MKLKELRLDSKAIEEGVWIDNIPEADDIRIRTRGIDNTDYKKMQNRLIKALPAVKRSRTADDPAIMEDITTRCIVETCFLAIEGLYEDDGEPVTAKERILELCLDPDYAQVRAWLAYAAAQAGRARAADEETAEGN